jgi:hypothetical protein
MLNFIKVSFFQLKIESIKTILDLHCFDHLIDLFKLFQMCHNFYSTINIEVGLCFLYNNN